MPENLHSETKAHAVSRFLWEHVFETQGRRLFCWLAVGVALGSVLFFAFPYELSGLWGLGLLVPGVVFLLCGWHAVASRLTGFALGSLGLGFMLAGFQTHRLPPMPALPTRATVLDGTVVSIDVLPAHDEEMGPEQRQGRRVTLGDVRFETALDSGMRPLRRTLRVTLRPDDPVMLQPGSRVSVRAMLRSPAPPAWPGGRDLQRESWFSGSAGAGYALGVVSLSGPVIQASPMERLRECVAARIANVLPGQTGAIAATLLAGVTAGLDSATRAAFSASGLAHLLAVAGLHLGLVMAVVIVSVRAVLALSERAALFWPCREIAGLSGLVVGGGYVLLTGAHLPSVRAYGMACIATLALLTGRRVLTMRALSLVALLILIVSPSVVLDVSFQMSFAAVMGLIAGYEVVREPLSRLRGEGGFGRVALSHLAALSLTSLLAGLATLPVTMAHFGVFQPWFILANLLAVPLAAIWIMPAGLVALLLMPFHFEGIPLRFMGAGIRLVRELASAVAAFPGASITVPAMPAWGLLFFMFGLSVLCIWQGRPRLIGLAPMMLALMSIWLEPRPVLLLSPDAGLMAVQCDGSLLAGPHGSLEQMALQSWQQALAVPVKALPDPCRAGMCRLYLNGFTMLLRPVDRSDGMIAPGPKECRDVQLFVSASPARGGCPGVPSLDRFSVWRDGAWAVYRQGESFRLVSDRSWRGARLWVLPIGSHGMPNLPLAQAE